MRTLQKTSELLHTQRTEKMTGYSHQLLQSVACSYVAGGLSYLVPPDGEVCEGGVSPESLGQLTQTHVSNTVVTHI